MATHRPVRTFGRARKILVHSGGGGKRSLTIIVCHRSSVKRSSAGWLNSWYEKIGPTYTALSAPLSIAITQRFTSPTPASSTDLDSGSVWTSTTVGPQSSERGSLTGIGDP